MTLFRTCCSKLVKLPGSKLYSHIVRQLSLIQPPTNLTVVTLTQAREQLVKYAEASIAAGSQWAGPDSQDGLTNKHMTDSFHTAVVPLGSDEELRRRYINSHNHVRFGRILEDMDSLAGLICFTHNMEMTAKDHNGIRPQSTVTACVDSINIHPELRFDPLKDIRISGHVIHVGQSSITVLMEVSQEMNGKWKKQIESTFIMVSKNPVTKGKAYANPLVVETEEEKRLHAFGAASRPSKDELFKKPTAEELSKIHDIFLQTIDQDHKTFASMVKPENCVWMKDTLLKNVIICFPEQRNIHGKIFGGFLMRQALELAWINACLHCKSRPALLNVDDIMFRESVAIGSLLYLSTQLTYTSGPYMQLRVHAEVYEPETGKRATTNTFHFTFIAREMPGEPRKEIPVPTVLPSKYAEYMLYLEGKRHFEKAASQQLE